MEVSDILHGMCSGDLSNADIKAICKYRGFSEKEASSRALFENFFLSDRGVEKAIASLGDAEARLLHLLKLLGEPVDITVFERIYKNAKSTGWYLTFTQEYQEVFKQVKSSLVRKGILLMAEDESTRIYQTAKLERWRFAFPREFERFLPPLFRSVKTFKENEDYNNDILRQVIIGIAKGDKGSPMCPNSKYTLILSGGELKIGEREFRIKYLRQWQRACWKASLSKSKGAKSPTKENYVSPIKAVTYALSQLKPDEWATPDQLSGLLKVFCGEKHPAPRVICEKGRQWGCLARQETNGKYYRLPLRKYEEEAASTDPGSYLQVDKNRSEVIVDLQAVPYDSLELISRVGNLKVEKGLLIFSPNIIRLGSVPEQTRSHELIRWLGKHSSGFRLSLEKVEQRHGKYIVHSNLMIAKIKDLSLKVSIQKLLSKPGKIAVLPGDYIAFPKELLPAVEKLVDKSGYVIKRIESKNKARDE